MIRRMLAAAAAAAVVSGVAAWPAWAAAGQADRAGQARHEATAEPKPRAGEWWFTTWKILPSVWPLTQGAGVTVAVLDSGVQASVPDLRGVVLPGGDVTGSHSNGETDFDTANDGHGTMMSVLIAGQGFGTGMVGIAPKAKILPVVTDANATASGAEPRATAAGIMYAANHGARVIDIPEAYRSASAAGCARAEQAAVAYAIARDIVVVASAGSTNLTGTGPTEPASCAGVLAVGAVAPKRVLWPLSTRQPYVSIVDPGADLITSGRDGRLLTRVSGTRAASALAAGAVALIRSRYPAMPWYRVIQRLTGTALPEGGHVPNDSWGSGILRLSHVVNASAFPVPASAPNPVYAKYMAFLASPQGRAVSRQLGRSAAGAAPPGKGASSAGKSGFRAAALIALAALLAVAVAVAVALGAPAKRRLALVKRRPASGAGRPASRRPARGGAWREPSGMAFPDLGYEPQEYLPDPEPVSGLLTDPSSDVFPGPPNGGEADGYLLFGERRQYRVPPYTPAPGRYSPAGDGSPASGDDDRLA